MNNQSDPWHYRNDLQEKIPLDELLPYCEDYETLALRVAMYGSTLDQAVLARFNQYLRGGELEAKIKAELERYLKASDVAALDASLEDDDWDDELKLDQMHLHPLQSAWFKTLVVFAGSVLFFGIVMLWYNSSRSAQDQSCDRECLREEAVIRAVIQERLREAK